MDDKLNGLNTQCMKCSDNQTKMFVYIDYGMCSVCHVGSQIHALDPDSVDSSSGLMEGYFDS